MPDKWYIQLKKITERSEKKKLPAQSIISLKLKTPLYNESWLF